MKIEVIKEEIEYQNPFEIYKRVSNNGENISLLMESRSLNLKYGRKSIIIPDPCIKISGIKDKFEILALTEAGKQIIKLFSKDDFSFCDDIEFNEEKINGTVIRNIDPNLKEKERLRQKNISYVLRAILDKFECENPLFALYGALTYDFSKNFYNGDNMHGQDFVFFLPTTVYHMDDIKEKASRLIFNFPGTNFSNHSCVEGFSFKKQKTGIEYDMSEQEYLEKAAKIISEIRGGRVMQCVFSRKLMYPLQKHPIKSYEELRKINPSPYSFFFNFGNNELLYGASPEMHIKIDKKEIEIRPIAGTIKRSKNPIEDADARISLLTDEKEKREHTMLVDLARHEIHGLADNVNVSDLFTLEVYPNLYHLVSGVNGMLKAKIDAVDALLLTMPAGTLSGAPKKEAMKMIDENENSERGFYGGCVGYLSFNGDCNTGITIRSIHVKDNKSCVRAGGGIVALSTPERELAEIKLKMENSIKILED